MTSIGIHDLSVATAHYVVDLTELAEAAGVPPQKYLTGLGQEAMSFPAPDEDIVTMGAAAALRVAFRFFAKAEKPRALGFGVWPLFEDARFDGPGAAPFLRREEFEQSNPEILWNALN